jgi:hypothetical protein
MVGTTTDHRFREKGTVSDVDETNRRSEIRLPHHSAAG